MSESKVADTLNDLIDVCKDGEEGYRTADVAVETYQRALQDGDLPARIRSLVERQYAQIKVACDSIRTLQLQHEH